MFVTNTGNDTIVKIEVDASFNPGTPKVFVNSINGADGLIIDNADNLWVAANQADEIVVVDPTGRAIASSGISTASIRGHGAGPAVSGESRLQRRLRLRDEPGARSQGRSRRSAAVDSAWAAAVTRFNVARIRAQIPPVR